MSPTFEEINDYSIFRIWPEKRYQVLQKWEYTADVEGARSGMVVLFLTHNLLIYSEIDEDPLYGGGYPIREKVQQLANYREAGPVHPFPTWLQKEFDAAIERLVL